MRCWFLVGVVTAALRNTQELYAQLYAHVGSKSESACEASLREMTGGNVTKELPAQIRRACTSSPVVEDKDKCAGVTSMASLAVSARGVGEPEMSPAEACVELEAFLLRLARDLHAIGATEAASPLCIKTVTEHTGSTPKSPSNFTAGLLSACNVSCEDVEWVAEEVLSNVTHDITPKSYCRLHEDWLEEQGIYDIDAFFALVMGQNSLAAAASNHAGNYPDALQASRDSNAAVYEILSRRPEAHSSVGHSSSAFVASVGIALFATF